MRENGVGGKGPGPGWPGEGSSHFRPCPSEFSGPKTKVPESIGMQPGPDQRRSTGWGGFLWARFSPGPPQWNSLI